MPEMKSLRMVLPPEKLSAFSLLLQQGVWLQAQTGCSVADLLTTQFGIAEDYIVERITTLFLDFKPVDDLETSFINNGSTLALSSAMPGLVGTTMRRGSHLAAMRGEISCHAEQQIESGPGRIKVKLFNLVMTELGAIFLAHGVCLSHAALVVFLQELDDNFWQSDIAVYVEDQQVDPASLLTQLESAKPDDEILLSVEFTS